VPEPTRLKVIVQAICDGLAAVTSEPLASCGVRYGPQHSFRLGSGEVALVVVEHCEWDPGGLVHSGNAWTEWPRFRVTIYVPEDEGEGSATEDLRLDLIDDVLAWLQSHRTVAAGVTGLSAMVVEVEEKARESGTEQLFRKAIIEVQAHRIRS